MRQDMARLFAQVAEVDAGAGRRGGDGGSAGRGVPGLRDGVRECEGVRDDAPYGSSLRFGPNAVVWVKRRLECRETSCPRKTFTGSVAQVPPRCRVTAGACGGPGRRWRPDGDGCGECGAVVADGASGFAGQAGPGAWLVAAAGSASGDRRAPPGTASLADR